MSNQPENSKRQFPLENEMPKYLLQPPVGVLTLEGKDVIDFIHRMSTNDLRNFNEGSGITTVFTNEKGRIIDVVDLYSIDGSIQLVYSKNAREKIKQIFDKYVIMEDVIVKENPGYAIVLSLSGGGKSREIFSGEADSFEMWSPRIFPEGKLYVTPEQNLRELNLIRSGKEIDFKEYNDLRLERGIPLFGIDFDDSVNPLESYLQEYISWNKGCYIGQEVIARLDTYQKIKRFLKGVVLEKPITEADQLRLENEESFPDIMYEGKSGVGTITSYGYSSALNTSIFMARLEKGMEKAGNRVEIVIGESRYSGTIIDLPFVN